MHNYSSRMLKKKKWLVLKDAEPVSGSRAAGESEAWQDVQVLRLHQAAQRHAWQIIPKI